MTRAEYLRAWKQRNGEKVRAYGRAGYHRRKAAGLVKTKTPEKNREYWLRHKYGMEQTDYDAMLTRQGGMCAIVGCQSMRLVVDHDHLSGEVRGLICQQHNVAIGQAHESAVELRALATYLETA